MLAALAFCLPSDLWEQLLRVNCFFDNWLAVVKSPSQAARYRTRSSYFPCTSRVMRYGFITPRHLYFLAHKPFVYL